VTSSVEEEVDKMVWAIRWGADTRDGTFRPGATSTPPANGFFECADPDRHGADLQGGWRRSMAIPSTRLGVYKDTLIEQCEQGVDYFTIHAGVRLPYIHLTGQPRHRHRLARWLDHGQVVPGASQGEFPLYALRRDLRPDAEIRRLVLLGDGLRPGSIAMPTTVRSLPNSKRSAKLTRSPGTRAAR